MHGDDFVAAGLAADLRWLSEYLRECFDIKVRATLGGDPDDDKQVVMLGRDVQWRDHGIELEADPRHRRLLLEGLGLDDSSSGLSHNGEHAKGVEEEHDIELHGSEATCYRALCARLNFVAQDSPDLQYPAKELSRAMARPTAGAWARLKKTVRFLVHRQRVLWTFAF